MTDELGVDIVQEVSDLAFGYGLCLGLVIGLISGAGMVMGLAWLLGD